MLTGRVKEGRKNRSRSERSKQTIRLKKAGRIEESSSLIRRNVMKRIAAIILAAIVVAGLSSCGIVRQVLEIAQSGTSDGTSNGTTDGTRSGQESGEAAVTDLEITAREATGEFSVETADGAFRLDGSVYKLTQAGT